MGQPEPQAARLAITLVFLIFLGDSSGGCRHATGHRAWALLSPSEKAP